MPRIKLNEIVSYISRNYIESELKYSSEIKKIDDNRFNSTGVWMSQKQESSPVYSVQT